ncbi:MAG: FAD-dependent oxidoreductase [Burkholderiaceae bacterium]|nr:FAD-dependent oxidoreductase [Burkholderiaceae bacterium]
MAASLHSTVFEPGRTLAVFGEFDLVVIGGGPAGIAASVAASRRGKKVLLIERYGFLGGMGTAGGVTNFAGLYGKRNGKMQPLVHGIVDELLDRIDALKGLNQPQDGMGGRIRVRSYDVSAYKCAADQLLRHAGVQILFHAVFSNVLMEGNRIHVILIETKSGRLAIRASHFIDCSGDADVAAAAGVPFAVGDGAGSGLFPTTMFRIGNVDAEKALAAIGEFKAIDAWMEKAASRYDFPRRGAILRPQRNPREWRANVTQIRNAQGTAVNALDAEQLSLGEVEGRRQVQNYMRFLKAEIPGFAEAEIIDIAPQIGIRESRRIHGVYQLTQADIIEGSKFEDSIGLNSWPMELHLEGKIEWIFPKDENNSFNQLPWRMLLPKGIHNLLVAGRCASMTHEAQSAARASGSCFVMGQAAGTAASLIHPNQAFDDLNLQSLQEALISDGAIL